VRVSKSKALSCRDRLFERAWLHGVNLPPRPGYHLLNAVLSLSFDYPESRMISVEDWRWFQTPVRQGRANIVKFCDQRRHVFEAVRKGILSDALGELARGS
jgi:hypothetical protein